MPPLEGLPALRDELAKMPLRSRHAILQALSDDERNALASRPAGSGETSSQLISSPYSPWLTQRVLALSDESTLDRTASRMTAASRQALLRAAGTPVSTAPAASTPGKSLFETFGGKLAARMARR